MTIARVATGSDSEMKQLWAEGNRFWLLRDHEGVCFVFLERNAPVGYRGPGRVSTFSSDLQMRRLFDYGERGDWISLREAAALG